MKKLFFLLLLGNVIFYLWVNNVQPKPDQDQRLSVDPSLERIVLQSELEPEPEQKPKKEIEISSKVELTGKEAAAETPIIKTETCYYTSPIKEWESSVALQTALKNEAVRSEILSEKLFENVGYWVMYPAAADMKQARANVRTLKEMGVKDYWLFRKGARKGAISLGMFKEQQRAEKIKAEWLAKGIHLEIRPHRVSREAFKLRINTDKSRQQLLEVIMSHLEPEIEIKLEDKSCN